VCPTGAYTKRERDGVVIHDQDACIGCTNCIRACPFGVPQYNELLEKAENAVCVTNALTQACPVCSGPASTSYDNEVMT